MMRKVYLAGPFRGYPGRNFDTFDHIKSLWQAAGWHVFSPACTSRALGYAAGDGQVDRGHLQHVMSTDIACLYAADAIALLQGWERSAGATVELALALYLGLLVFNAETCVQVEVESLPWAANKEQSNALPLS